MVTQKPSGIVRQVSCKTLARKSVLEVADLQLVRTLNICVSYHQCPTLQKVLIRVKVVLMLFFFFLFFVSSSGKQNIVFVTYRNTKFVSEPRLTTFWATRSIFSIWNDTHAIFLNFYTIDTYHTHTYALDLRRFVFETCLKDLSQYFQTKRSQRSRNKRHMKLSEARSERKKERKEIKRKDHSKINEFPTVQAETVQVEMLSVSGKELITADNDTRWPSYKINVHVSIYFHCNGLSMEQKCLKSVSPLGCHRFVFLEMEHFLPPASAQQ